MVLDWGWGISGCKKLVKCVIPAKNHCIRETAGQQLYTQVWILGTSGNFYPPTSLKGPRLIRGGKGQPLSQNVHREQVWLGGGWSCDHHPPPHQLPRSTRTL